MAEAIAKAILTEGLKKLIGSITAKRYDDAANIVRLLSVLVMLMTLTIPLGQRLTGRHRCSCGKNC